MYCRRDGVEARDSLLSINPELAPQDLILEQAMIIEKMPEEEKLKLTARLSELKVVLIRNLISDQLRYINVAREWFTVNDLYEIRRHKIGNGQNRRESRRHDAGQPHRSDCWRRSTEIQRKDSGNLFHGIRYLLFIHGIE